MRMILSFLVGLVLLLLIGLMAIGLETTIRQKPKRQSQTRYYPDALIPEKLERP